MSKRKQEAIWVAVLSVICGLIVWHAVLWHYNGMHLTMLKWTTTDRTYITVLYNLGLIIAISTTLGILMGNITDIVSSKFRKPVKLDKGERDITGT